MADDDTSTGSKPMNTGERGPAFRQWQRDFGALSLGKFAKDDRYSFMITFLRKDEGGTGQGAVALPAQTGGSGGGTNPSYTQAINKQKMRHGQAFKWLYECQSSDSIKNMLFDLAQTNPAELPGDAYDLVVRECQEPSDDLELARQDQEWQNDTIMNTVGHSISTITDFSRHLDTRNGKRPANSRKSESERAVKLLASIVYPESLHRDAVKELASRHWRPS